MVKKLLFLFLVLFFFKSYSQSNLLWSKSYDYGGSYSHPLMLPQLGVTNDTIIVMGNRFINNSQTFSIVKYDLNGDLLSANDYATYSFPFKIVDYKIDDSQNVYLLNQEYLDGDKRKVIIQKYEQSGSLVWEDEISSPADTSYFAGSLAIQNNSEILISNYKEYDYGEDYSGPTAAQTRAYNASSGTVLWEREFDAFTEIENFNSIFIKDQEVFLFGYNRNNERRLIKLDSNYNQLLNTIVQTSTNDVVFSQDGNLFFTTGGYSFNKVDLNGTTIWSTSYVTGSSPVTINDQIKAITQDEQGNIYVTGRQYGNINSNYTNADILTLKYDSSGNFLWENRYKNQGTNAADIGNAIDVKNGYVYVGGESQKAEIGTYYDYVALKINANSGANEGIYRYDGTNNGEERITSLQVLDNGNVALTGLTFNDVDYNWNTQLLSDINLSVKTPIAPQVIMFPNPLSSDQLLYIEGSKFDEYKLFSLQGKLLLKGSFEAQNSQRLNLEKLSSGIYFITVSSKLNSTTKKIIIK